MECLFCSTPLSPVRVLENGQFCSGEHALLSAVGREPSEAYYFFELREPRSCQSSSQQPLAIEPLVPAQIPELPCLALNWSFPELERHVPLDVFPNPVRPRESEFQVDAKSQAVSLLFPTAALNADFPASLKPESEFAKAFHRVPAFKLLGLAAALSLVAVLSYSVIHAKPSNGLRVVEHVRATIGHRAAVDLNDDFRSGMRDWQTKSGLASAWTYDRTGFVRPGALALYRPTLELANYTVNFVTQTADRPLGVAYRVNGWDNFYALKLNIVSEGVHPRIDVARYAVVNGRQTGLTLHCVPAPVRNLSLYHIKLNLDENNFTLIAEGHVVDYWSDRRYAKGGFGFFSGKGERARVISVEVSHQHDWLGRFCALLTPYEN